MMGFAERLSQLRFVLRAGPMLVLFAVATLVAGVSPA